jgi:hypothetical protein
MKQEFTPFSSVFARARFCPDIRKSPEEIGMLTSYWRFSRKSKTWVCWKPRAAPVSVVDRFFDTASV